MARFLVGAALTRPGFAVPVPIKDHHLVCIVADVSTGKGGAVRGSLKLFGELGRLDVVVGHGEGAPGVVDQSIDAETAQIQETMLPALLEAVAAAADEPEPTEPGRLKWDA